MEKLYERIVFHNEASPALNETNLNLISKAIDDIDNRLIEVADNIDGLAGLNQFLQSAQFIEQTDVALSTSSTTSVIFEDSRIYANTAIEVMTTLDGLRYDSMTLTNGTCTIVFPVVESATTINVKIYFK
jgi:hypothetical protein